MSRCLLSPLAATDLSDIWEYSVQQWGTERADGYILAIRDACKALAAGALPGLDAGRVRPGYRKHACGSHLLFYRTAADGDIVIVRILHQRMDVDSHL